MAEIGGERAAADLVAHRGELETLFDETLTKAEEGQALYTSAKPEGRRQDVSPLGLFSQESE